MMADKRIGAEIGHRVVGSAILQLITAGMYSDPLIVFREYIQNSADALESVVQDRRAEVRIALDQSRRMICIRDNGPGLSVDEASDVLVRVASSDKDQAKNRGFRGIGRLVGLAFAGSVVFFTRRNSDEDVTRVEWNRSAMQAACERFDFVADVIRACVRISSHRGSEWPSSFFEVQICGIALHSASVLLNRDTVRRYIGQVCPVPFSLSFPFRESAYNVFQQDPLNRELDIYLEGDSHPIVRPHHSAVSLSHSRDYAYSSFERIEINSLDGLSPSAIGWVAHWAYAGAIPMREGVRGIRARRGNIQIGSDVLFDHLFKEERFNRWCVGELYIMNSRIVPNARRDYFEHNADLRDFENQLGAVLHRLATRCRAVSSSRNRERRLADSLEAIRSAHALAVSGFVDISDAKSIVRKALAALAVIRRSAEDGETGGSGLVDECALVESEFRTIDWEKVNHIDVGIPRVDMRAYQRVFGAVVECANSSTEALRLIRAVIKRMAG